VTREWYVTADGTRFCVESDLWAMRCQVPTVPDGDGADTIPLAERTGRCHHRTGILVGSMPTCGHHLEVVFRLAGTKAPESIPACPA